MSKIHQTTLGQTLAIGFDQYGAARILAQSGPNDPQPCIAAVENVPGNHPDIVSALVIGAETLAKHGRDSWSGRVQPEAKSDAEIFAPPTSLREHLSEKTVDELKQIAAEGNIDLTDRKKKADIIDALVEAAEKIASTESTDGPDGTQGPDASNGEPLAPTGTDAE